MDKNNASRPVVYICSPFSGDVAANQKKARKYCRFAVDKGYIPLAPHLLFPQFMDDDNPNERDLAMSMDAVLLARCAELWVFGNRISRGMGVEITKAEQERVRIRYFTEGMEELA